MKKVPKEAFRERYLNVFKRPLDRKFNYSVTLSQPDRANNNGNCFKLNVSINGGNVAVSIDRPTEAKLLKDTAKIIETLEKINGDTTYRGYGFTGYTHFFGKNVYVYNLYNGSMISFDFSVPFTKHYKEKLEEARFKTDSNKDGIIYTVGDSLFYDKYNTKMVIKFRDNSSRESLLRSFEPIFNIFGEQEESDEHKFSKQMMTCYRNLCKSKSQTIRRPGSFTIYLDQPDSRSYISIFNKTIIDIVRTEYIIKVEEHRYVGEKSTPCSIAGNPDNSESQI